MSPQSPPFKSLSRLTRSTYCVRDKRSSADQKTRSRRSTYVRFVHSKHIFLLRRNDTQSLQVVEQARDFNELVSTALRVRVCNMMGVRGDSKLQGRARRSARRSTAKKAQHLHGGRSASEDSRQCPTSRTMHPRCSRSNALITRSRVRRRRREAIVQQAVCALPQRVPMSIKRASGDIRCGSGDCGSLVGERRPKRRSLRLALPQRRDNAA